jgi:two-component system cell cycle sensor histidine kinase/response regulator CckA
MVYAVVTKSGGSVWVESDPDQGASFFVALPAATAVEAEETKALESGDTPTPSATVLLVEDQPEVRHLARQLLEKAGHRVLEAGDAGAALRLAAEHQGPIDLLLSDVVMPGRSGIELARDLRRQRPETRVLFMTGYADLPEEIAGELLRQSRYLSKPFTREGLQREVREALKGHTSEVVSSRKPSRVP